MVDIFDEVDEDLRADRARAFARKHGLAVCAAGLLLVALVAAWQSWTWWEARRDLAAAGEYLAAVRSLHGTGPGGGRPDAAAVGMLQNIARSGPSGYATLARLQVAAAAAADHRGTEASSAWDGIARERSADPGLSRVARFLRLEHQVDSEHPTAAGDQLGSPAATPADPWQALASETKGLLDLRNGQPAAAADAFRALAQDPNAPEGVRERARVLLGQVQDGGTP